MRLQHVFIVIITLVLAAVTMLGAVYTDQFTQASVAESGSFDALAHALFDDILGVNQDAR